MTTIDNTILLEFDQTLQGFLAIIILTRARFAHSVERLLGIHHIVSTL